MTIQLAVNNIHGHFPSDVTLRNRFRPSGCLLASLSVGLFVLSVSFDLTPYLSTNNVQTTFATNRLAQKHHVADFLFEYIHSRDGLAVLPGSLFSKV